LRLVLQPRLEVSARGALTTRLIGASTALTVTGLVLFATGRNPLNLAWEGIKSTFTTQIGFEDTLVLATPILMAAVAVAIGFRARVWNIGVAGQFYMGAWGAAAVGLFFDGPAPLAILLMAVAAAVCGGLWALGPGLAKAYLNINEVVTTLLLNFVALQWVIWWSTDYWRDPELGVLSATRRITAELPLFPGAISLHTGFLVPVVLVVIFAVVFRTTIWGYEVDLTGGKKTAAAYAGIPVARRIVTVLVLSGAIGGLSGMVQLVGTAHRLTGTLENSYGISGFIVAALAGSSFLALLAVGGFVAFLLHTGIVLSTQAGGISVNLVVAIYGFILIAVGVAEVATRYRIVVIRSAERSPPPTAQTKPPIAKVSS